MSKHPKTSTATEEIVPTTLFNPNAPGCTILVGIVLCFTGIGALLGIPMLYEGYKREKNPPTEKAWKGKCPYCHEDLFIQQAFPAANCPYCRKRIVVNGNMFAGYD